MGCTSPAGAGPTVHRVNLIRMSLLAFRPPTADVSPKDGHSAVKSHPALSLRSPASAVEEGISTGSAGAQRLPSAWVAQGWEGRDNSQEHCHREDAV